jgi:hypothetical protein
MGVHPRLSAVPFMMFESKLTQRYPFDSSAAAAEPIKTASSPKADWRTDSPKSAARVVAALSAPMHASRKMG